METLVIGLYLHQCSELLTFVIIHLIDTFLVN